MHAGGTAAFHVDATHHGEVADLGAGAHRARNPGHQRALLGVGRAAERAKAAIDAGRRSAARRRKRGERRWRPRDAERLRAARQHHRGRIELVRAVGIARPLRTPWISYRAGDLQRLLDLVVVVPHLAPIERPVGAVAEKRARLEPFRAKAQRHHREMHGRAADRLAGIVGAELKRILAVDDALISPVELRLLRLVRGEILERTPVRTGIERHDREACLREPAGQRSAAGAGADDGEIDRVVVAVFAHRHPGADAEHVGRASVARARGARSGSSAAARLARASPSHTPILPVSFAPHGPAWPRPLPRDRGGRPPCAHSRAGSPVRPSRSRSRRWDARSSSSRCRAARGFEEHARRHAAPSSVLKRCLAAWRASRSSC